MLITAPEDGTDVALDGIDLFDPDRFRQEGQHATFATLRREAPVFCQDAPTGEPFWSLTKYADVDTVLRDVHRFSSERGTILAVTEGDSAGGRTINLMDPPKHSAVRAPTFRKLAKSAVERVAPRVRERVRAVVEPWRDGGAVDLAAAMLDLPMAAVGETIGIPEEYWHKLPRWAMAGVAPLDPYFAAGESHETLRAAHYDLFAMFSSLIERRRVQPKDDLISVLVQLRMGDRRLTEYEVLLNCYSFVMGAVTTTPHAATHTLLELARMPEAWDRLAADPSLAGRAVEEGLRWSTPTNHLMRRTTCPVTIRGTDIPEGAAVVAWVASANRDEDVFSSPFVFDPARDPNPHIAFGVGPHLCIGAAPARTAMTMLLQETTAALMPFEPSGPVTHLCSNFINGITSAPVTMTPRVDVRGRHTS